MKEILLVLIVFVGYSLPSTAQFNKDLKKHNNKLATPVFPDYQSPYRVSDNGLNAFPYIKIDSKIALSKKCKPLKSEVPFNNIIKPPTAEFEKIQDYLVKNDRSSIDNMPIIAPYSFHKMPITKPDSTINYHLIVKDPINPIVSTDSH